MKFIGQMKLLRELNLLTIEVRKGFDYNILLSAPSGYGKTTLGLMLLNNWDSFLRNSEIVLPPDFIYRENLRFHLIDEIQELDSPEILYPFLDSKGTHILCTNEQGNLKEPLVNRCIPFFFEDYTEEEKLEITRNLLEGYNLPDNILIRISSKVENNPRKIKILCQRLNYVFRNYGVPSSDTQLDLLCNDILNISEDGLSELERRYINIIARLGRASIDNLCNLLHVPKTTILRDIEPRLLYKNIIKITSKGREYNNGNDY